MSKKLAVLGLAALAVLAVSAMSASAASAAEFHCTATTANCIVTSESSDNVFTVNTGNVKCTSAKIEGTVAKETSSATLNAKYTGCKAFGVKASVEMESCHYTFNLTSSTEVSTNVNCTGTPITVTPVGINCTVTVGAQTGLTGITVANEGTEPTDIHATINVGGIKFTETGNECAETIPGQKGGTFETGKYTGSATLKGFNDNEGVEGTQVGLHVF